MAKRRSYYGLLRRCGKWPQGTVHFDSSINKFYIDYGVAPGGVNCFYISRRDLTLLHRRIGQALKGTKASK